MGRFVGHVEQADAANRPETNKDRDAPDRQLANYPPVSEERPKGDVSDPASYG